MNRLLVIVVTILGIVIVSGCAQRQVATVPEEPVAQPMTDADKQRAEEGTARMPKETISERPVAQGQQTDGTSSVEELQTKLKDIHFDYDKYAVREDAKPTLKDLASILSKNKALKVIVEGHCDERGTSEYNLALGDRRAKTVKDYLTSLGIPSHRIESISYGAEKPLCAENSENCWAKNRRAHFVLIKETS